ncbi:MAG: hypothetical protein ACU837_13300 [Gammaproteobacteria bacterium]
MSLTAAKAQQCGDKSSEITAVRTRLKDSGLENQKLTLDTPPLATTQIHQAGGVYLWWSTPP